MEVYRKEYKIRSCDVDMYRRLRLSRLFTFTQEAAISHTELLGAGREKTLDRGFLWVITMQHAEFVRLPEYDEEITLTSWAGNTMHVMFPRFFEFAGSDGNVIVRGSSVWMLMDINTRKMIFPDAEGISVKGFVRGGEYPLPRPVRPSDCTESAQFEVAYSYCDINGHLTNTRYFDIAEDLTSQTKSGRVPVYAAVEYSGEAKMNEIINIAYSDGGDESFLCGTKDEGKKVFKLLMKY